MQALSTGRSNETLDRHMMKRYLMRAGADLEKISLRDAIMTASIEAYSEKRKEMQMEAIVELLKGIAGVR